jgi:hypothetical protein
MMLRRTDEALATLASDAGAGTGASDRTAAARSRHCTRKARSGEARLETADIVHSRIDSPKPSPKLHARRSQTSSRVTKLWLGNG